MEVQDSVDKMRSEGLIEVSLFGVRYRISYPRLKHMGLQARSP